MRFVGVVAGATWSSRQYSHEACSINTPNGGGCMHRSTVAAYRRREATPANGTERACPGRVVVERGRTGTRARVGRSTPRRPGAALGDVPALMGGGGSRLARVLARPLRARCLTRYGLVGTRSRISGASLTRGVGSGQARTYPSPPPSVCPSI